jgi:signal transduction histidine kinase
LAHEAVAVGLSAEALAHEVVSIADRLAREARTIRKKATWSEREAKHLADIVEAGARSLSKQASYVSPTLRYRREDRGPNKVGMVCEAVADYHTDRMRDYGIVVRLDCVTDFSVRMNRGRLTQVLDNLILNSEFWILDQQRRSGKSQDAEILLTVDRPRIVVTDTGPGISPSVENSLFEPFVTTKPRGTGRGLGLFIARQLLEYAGGSIELSDSVARGGRHNGFVVDLSGAME